MFRGSFDAAITWSETPRFTMLITEYDNSAVAAASGRPLTYASTLESYPSTCEQASVLVVIVVATSGYEHAYRGA